ncbi:D-2-hydroxyacid dehydrogenase [Caenimonas terrae]|uniref:D-2-hydroxyacid dehydrogenase n=1 Tax=Caenimonas terrae TaxID=696074 RepID=A0ABW0NJC4_9BURK
MPTLLISSRIRREFGDPLQAAAGDGLRLFVSDPESPLTSQQLAEVDIALLSLDVIDQSTKTVLTPQMRFFCDQLRAASGLQWLHVPTAGVDRPIFQEMLRRGVRLTNSSGANAEAVAHTAVMGVMVLARGALKWIHAQREHRWTPLRGADAPGDLAGQTAIVVGYGPIGRSIARSLEALGLTVHKLRHSPQPGDAGQGIHGYARLPALAGSAQWLVMACPLTEATRRLVNASVLAAMPRGSFVVNVGRGGVLDEQALLDALASGQIAGAHLDVFEQEPLASDSPFWDLPNVLVSPHNAGSTAQYGDRCVHMFLDNLRRWVAGRPLVQEVARDRTLKSSP